MLVALVCAATLMGAAATPAAAETGQATPTPTPTPNSTLKPTPKPTPSVPAVPTSTTPAAPSRAELTGAEGTRTRRTVTVDAPTRADALRAVMAAPATGRVRVTVGSVRRVGPGKFEIDIDIEAPASSAGTYQRSIVIKTSGGPDRTLVITIVVTRRGAAGPVPTSPRPPSPDRITKETNGQLVVRDELVLGVSFDEADPGALASRIAAAERATIIGAIPATRTYQLQFPGATLAQVKAHITAVAATPGVDSASLNVIENGPLARIPDDPEYDSWDAARPAGNNADLEMIDAPGGWDITTGSSAVKVGVVDQNFDTKHPDLDGNIGRYDGPGSDPDQHHGTHVAGTICAEGNNHAGVTGVAWDCDLRLFPVTGWDAVSLQQRMVNAVDDGDRIVNMSLQVVENNKCGTAGTDLSLRLVKDSNDTMGRAILYAQRTRHDVLWVFAAGNECRDARYASPASLVDSFPTNVVTVGSVNRSGVRSAFSNTGRLITVSAPGGDTGNQAEVGIFNAQPSTSTRSCRFLFFGCSTSQVGQYGYLSGTSMAAPHVSGLAALMFSHDPSMTAARAKECMVASAHVIAPSTARIINVPDALKCQAQINLPSTVDVVFSVDLTGSMGSVVDQVKSDMTRTISDLRAASPSTIFTFGVVSFEDYPGSFDSRPCGSTYSATYGDSGDQPFRINTPLTTDPAAVQSAVDAMHLGSGGDGPEAYARALWELSQPDTAATMGFRPDALKLVINFGDNVPHDRILNEGVDGVPGDVDTGDDPGRNGRIDCGGDDIDWQTGSLQGLRDKGIRLLHVDSSGGTYEAQWRQWASRTGGSYTQENPSDGRTLSQIVLELIRSIQR